MKKHHVAIMKRNGVRIKWIEYRDKQIKKYEEELKEQDKNIKDIMAINC